MLIILQQVHNIFKAGPELLMTCHCMLTDLMNIDNLF
jgi:hypothetical protein